MKTSGSKSCSLVITTYNWPEALDLTLKSALLQSDPPDQIVVADDCNAVETAALVEKHRLAATIPVHHLWQKDLGFRLAASRSRAIAFSVSDDIVLVDRDMVLHPDFIPDHRCMAQRGSFIKGSHALLHRLHTLRSLETGEFRMSLFAKGLVNRKNAIRIPKLSYLLAFRPCTSLKGIRGCNLSFSARTVSGSMDSMRISQAGGVRTANLQ